MPRIISGCAAVLAAAVIASTPQQAAAHALVLESTPAPGAMLSEPPAKVYLRFNSKLEKRLSHVTLSPEEGRRVALPIAVNVREKPDRLGAPLAPLPPGGCRGRYQ